MTAKRKLRPAAKDSPGLGKIREEILREWRGIDEPADLNAHVHPAEKFLAAILKAAGAELYGGQYIAHVLVLPGRATTLSIP